MTASDPVFSSELRIAYSRLYVVTAQAWAAGFASALNAPASLQFSLRLLLEESLLFIIDKYPDADKKPDLQIVLSANSPGHLQAQIDDLGPPIPAFLGSREAPSADPNLDLWLTVSKGYAEDFEFINRGQNGWQIRFSLQSDDWLLPQDVHPQPAANSTAGLSGLAVRPVVPADTAEIARLTYATYRYSYQHPEIYDLERYARKLTDGGHDVAVVPFKEKLIGMAAIKHGGLFERGAEAGTLMVDPEFRRRGVRQLLDGWLDYHFTENPSDIDFFYGYQVTQHDKTQRGADPGDATHFAPTSFFLNKNPAINFIGLNSTTLTRDSAIEAVMPTKPLCIDSLYVPNSDHQRIVETMVKGLGLNTQYHIANGLPAGATALTSHSHDTSRYTTVAIQQLGTDWQTVITAELIRLFGQGQASVRLLIDATEDYPSALHDVLREIGAGFCGITVLSSSKIAISYVLTKDPVGFESMVVYRESARQLLDFVKHQWPGDIAIAE